MNPILVLALVVITSFLTPFLGSSVNIALPAIASELHMSAVGLSWVSMSFLLSSAVFLVPLGRLADLVGRVRIFIYGTIIVALSSFLCAWSQSEEMLIASRVVQGIGSAMMFGTNMAIVTSVFPPERRGWAIGITVTSVYLGLSAAPVVGGLMTEMLGWRSIFYLTGPLGLGVAVAGLLVLRPGSQEGSGQSFDFKGSLVYVLSMSGLMFGLSKLPQPFAIALVGAGIGGLLLFGWLELRTQAPVFNVRLFLGNRVFALSNLAALINYATTFAVTFILSLYLQYIKGLTPKEAGLLLVAQPVMMALVASFSGRWSDRFPPRLLASGGMAVIAVGLVMLLWLHAGTGSGYLLTALLVLGVGFGLFSSPNTNSVMSSVERKDLGIASATVATMRLTGQMVSMAIATLVIQLFMGNARITPETESAFLKTIPVTFTIFLILIGLGIWASLARERQATN
ncbi:MAG: MFS transporter [Bacteroidales bacterium]